MESDIACSIESVRFSYKGQREVFHVEEFQVRRGEAVLLTGESGAGKSTLLGLLCGVLEAGDGVITVDGHPLRRLNGAARDRLRADAIGYMFQSLNLLPYLTALDNVLLAGRFSRLRAKRAGASTESRRSTARSLLEALGIDSVSRRADRLSVGQQQRVAAARALFGAPALLVADEPTAALDAKNRERFLGLLLTEARKSGAGLVVVSHDPDIANRFDRQHALAAIARWDEH